MVGHRMTFSCRHLSDMACPSRSSWEKRLLAGHNIFFGVPNPEDEKNKKLIDSIGPNNVPVGSVGNQ